MEYSISEIASMLGISNSTLRFFEKNGLVYGERDQNNGYRHYQPIDLNRLLRVKTYTECGFTLRETESILKMDSLEGIAELYERRSEEEARAIAFRRICQHYMEDMACQMRKMVRMKGKWCVDTRPAMYCFPFRTQDEIEISEAMKKKIREWVNLKPLSQSLVLVSFDQLEENAQVGRFGMLMEERYAREAGVASDEFVSYLPENRRCVYAVDIGNTQMEEGRRNWARRLACELEEAGLEAAGEVVGRVLFTGQGRNTNLPYAVEYWIPVKNQE